MVFIESMPFIDGMYVLNIDRSNYVDNMTFIDSLENIESTEYIDSITFIMHPPPPGRHIGIDG